MNDQTQQLLQQLADAPDKSPVFYQTITERIAGVPTASEIRDVTAQDFIEVLTLHKQGKCPHTIVQDDYMYLYDYRSCFICGKGLGLV